MSLEITRHSPNSLSFNDRASGRTGSMYCGDPTAVDAAEAQLRAGTYQFAGASQAPVGNAPAMGNYQPPILPLPTLNFEPKLQQPGHGQMPTAPLPPEAPAPHYAGAGFPAANYTPEVLLPPTMNFAPPTPTAKARADKGEPAPAANASHDPNVLLPPQMQFGTEHQRQH